MSPRTAVMPRCLRINFQSHLYSAKSDKCHHALQLCGVVFELSFKGIYLLLKARNVTTHCNYLISEIGENIID